MRQIQSFVDDSGSNEIKRTTPDTRNHFVLAGFTLPAEPYWMNFSDAWEAELQKPPKIEYFKASEAFRLDEQFEGMPWTLRDCKVDNLVRIIKQYQPVSLYNHLSWRDYNEYFKGKVPAIVDSPYFILFYATIGLMVIAQERHDFHEKVDFVFDKQGEIEEERALAWYHLLKGNYPEVEHILGSTPIFRDDKDVLPLQAADMYAWHVRRSLDYPGEVLSRMPSLEINHVASRQIDAKLLTKLASDMNRAPKNERI